MIDGYRNMASLGGLGGGEALSSQQTHGRAWAAGRQVQRRKELFTTAALIATSQPESPSNPESDASRREWKSLLEGGEGEVEEGSAGR
jgi:hypothetical protein